MVLSDYPHPEYRGAVWGKSSKSGSSGNCVNVASLASSVGEAAIGIRDSNDPEGAVLEVSRLAMRLLVRRIKRSELDL